MDNDDRIAILY